jgi:hypothetical protein
MNIDELTSTIHRLDIEAQYYESKKSQVLEEREKLVAILRKKITNKSSILIEDPPLSSRIVYNDNQSYFRYIINGQVFDATKSWRFVNHPTGKSRRCVHYTDITCPCEAWHIGQVRDIPKDSLQWALRKNDKERMQVLAAILTERAVNN